MTCCAPDGDETFLMPLKRRKQLPCPGDGQSLREKRCETGLDKCSAPSTRRRSAGAVEVNDSAVSPGPSFEDSVEWQSTKCVAAGLFRALGQHYDEPWFPTVVNEWSALYYQCNHAADYWCARDEWLAGDEEVRLAVWSEVLSHREQHDRQLEQLNRNVLCDTGKCDQNADLMDVHGGCIAEATETYGSPNKANDRFDLPHKVYEQSGGEDLQYTDERVRAEAEVAEIALADPDDDPDWVQMRRKMRGSFVALNMAQCEVSAELLDHIMIELCKYWANASVSENSGHIDPQLERNIMREIQNFRFKIFGMAVEIEPELQQSSPDAFREQEPRSKPKSSRKPEPESGSRESEPRRKPKPRRGPEPCSPPEPEPLYPREPEQLCPREPKSCGPQEPKQCTPQESKPCCPPEPKPFLKPEPCCPRKPEHFCPLGPEPYCSQEPVPCCPLPPPKLKCCAPRRSSKTKMAEARARHNATQVRDRDITTGWLGGRPNP